MYFVGRILWSRCEWNTLVIHGRSGCKILNIRKLVGPGRWFYVPTSVNPTDAALRVMFQRKFVESELWWKGPNFLNCEKERRPIQIIKIENKKSLLNAEENQTVALVVVEGSVVLQMLLIVDGLESCIKWWMLRHMRIDL